MARFRPSWPANLAAGLCLLATGAALPQTGVPDAARAEIDRGIALFRASNFAAAKLKFTAAVRADPRSADALTWRGIAENQLKQYTEAAGDLRAALRLNPGETAAHYNLALSLIRLSQPEDAMEQLRIVTDAHPGVVEPEYNLAILLEGKHSLPEAVEHLQAAFASQPNDPGVAQHLLTDLLTLGRTDEARALLQRLPSESSAQIEQQAGAALIEAGQFRAAIVPLEAAPTQASEKPPLRLLLARAYVGAEECSKAAALLTASAAVPADSTGETAYLLGLAYACTGATSEAKDAFAAAIRAKPNNSAALYHLGLIESAIPVEQPAAIRDLRAATRIEPANAAYAVVLSRVLLAQDKTREAMVLLEGIHPRGPEAAERDLLLGITQMSIGGAKLAFPALKRAAAESPSLPLPHNILGFCYFQQGEYALAAESYAWAADLWPESGRFAHDAAVAFERANDLNRAMSYAARAVALTKASADDHYLVGKLLARAGRKQEAVNELQQAVALDPRQDAACYLLARTYQQLGDAAQADAWNARFRELKQRQSRDYAQRKQAEAGRGAVRTSKLLEGAPVLHSQQDAP